MKLFASIRIFLLLLILVISSSFSVFKSHEQLKFKRIGEDTGISSSWVRCVYQDDKGYIWFGTSDGINRYDAYECKTIRPTDQYGVAYVGTHINEIKKKSAEELWVASYNNMYVLKNNTLQVYKNLPSLEYFGIVKGIKNHYWALSDKGLIDLDVSAGNYTIVTNKKTHPTFGHKIISYFEDADKNIWFGASGTLFKYNIVKDSFQKFTDFEGLDKDTTNDISSITQDQQGRLWVGFGQNGVYYNDPCNSNYGFQKFCEGPIMDLYVDSTNILWIAKGSNQGLTKVDLNTNQREIYRHEVSNPFSLSDSSLSCVFEDKTGDLWIGTYGSGANYYSKRRKNIYTIQKKNGNNFLRSNLVNAIAADEEYLWMGSESGIDRLGKKEGCISHYQYKEGDPKSLRRNSVQTLFFDSHENLWVGTWEGGLLRYIKETDDFKRYQLFDYDNNLKSDKVVDVKQGKDGKLWIATHEGGVFEYNYESDKLESHFRYSKTNKGIPNLNIGSIQPYTQNEIIINTYESLQFYNPYSNVYQEYSFRSANGNLSNILCTYIDVYQQIWVGTNIGLYLFDRVSGSYRLIDLNIDKVNLSIQAITQDAQETLWLATNQGIFSMDLNHNVKRLTKQDGLTTNDFKRKAVFKSDNGFLYFGSSSGVNYFHPKELVTNTNPPKLEITSLSVLKSRPNEQNVYEYILESFDSEKQIELDKKQSSFEITFTGLNYLDPERNNYKYILEGYDKRWIDAKNTRMATYTNLSPGNYTFKLSGTNNDNVSAKAIKTIKIKKIGPWYLSKFVKWLAIFIAVSFPFVFYFVRLSIFKKQKNKLKEMVAEQTKELTSANQLLTKQTEKIVQQNIELSNHRNNLEDLVAQRTVQLEKAKIRAEESDSLKSAFMANMSHEIRTPMNAIYGFSGLLDDEQLTTDEKKEYIDIIKNSCESLLVLIDDILDISIMDAQGINLNLQQINIHDLLNQLEIVLKKNEKPHVTLTYDNKKENNYIVINTDPVRLRQILTNLVNNAIKFTEKGSVNFGFYTSNKNIVFYVKDTGIGISTKDLNTIFKPFRKAANNDRKLYRGTGIGLSISERIVSSFKGEIWVESRLGEGAKFFVQLPLIQQ